MFCFEDIVKETCNLTEQEFIEWSKSNLEKFEYLYKEILKLLDEGASELDSMFSELKNEEP